MAGYIDLESDIPVVRWPARAPAPEGWKFGSHASLQGSRDGRYLFREEDEATVFAQLRDELTLDDAPSEEELLEAIRARRNAYLVEMAERR